MSIAPRVAERREHVGDVPGRAGEGSRPGLPLGDAVLVPERLGQWRDLGLEFSNALLGPAIEGERDVGSRVRAARGELGEPLGVDGGPETQELAEGEVAR